MNSEVCGMILRHETISMGKNIHYRTAWEHYRCGKIPGAYQLQTGNFTARALLSSVM